jgi:hypothetical protein
MNSMNPNIAAAGDEQVDNDDEGCDDDVARTKNCHESICSQLRLSSILASVKSLLKLN